MNAEQRFPVFNGCLLVREELQEALARLYVQTERKSGKTLPDPQILTREEFAQRFPGGKVKE